MNKSLQVQFSAFTPPPQDIENVPNSKGTIPQSNISHLQLQFEQVTDLK